MFSEDISVNILDVLLYMQGKTKCHTRKRSFYALSFRLNSNSKYIYKNRQIAAITDSISLVPANVSYDRITDNEEVIVFHFEMFNCIIDEIQVAMPENPDIYKKLFKKALAIWSEKKPGYKYKVTSVFYDILSKLQSDGCFKTETKSGFVRDAVEYMKNNFSDSSLTVNLLAKRACVSEAFFRRQFNKYYGTSPKKYLDTIRIQYAVSLLKTGYFTQKEIAQRCGFSEVKYFRTAFKNKTGKCISRYNYDSSNFINSVEKNRAWKKLCK